MSQTEFEKLDVVTQWKLQAARGINNTINIPTIAEYNAAIKDGRLTGTPI